MYSRGVAVVFVCRGTVISLLADVLHSSCCYSFHFAVHVARHVLFGVFCISHMPYMIEVSRLRLVKLGDGKTTGKQAGWKG